MNYFWLIPLYLCLSTPTLPIVETDIENDIPYLVEFYKDLHQHPELSHHEVETSAKLTKALKEVGYDVTTGVGGHGIVGILRNGDGPQILYRTDMDALPMLERTELPYASEVLTTNNGAEVSAMHSCGHDMHMSVWLGTARYMAANKDKWKGTLMLIGQPAEELGAGAKAMIEDGLYQRFGVPDFGLGLHCNPTLPAGQVAIDKGFSMANTEKISITVYGVGAHGASPHMSIDPIVISSMLVMELQTIVSRNLKPIDDAVVTVGVINGGTQFNIIPDRVQLELTVRTYTDEVQALVRRRIKEIADGVAMTAGLPKDKWPTVDIADSFTPANYNDPTLTEHFRSSAAKVIGLSNVAIAEPQMVGEDFARYSKTPEEVPTILYWLGTVPAERLASGDLPGLHSPYYYPEIETSLTTGVKVTSQALSDLFNQ